MKKLNTVLLALPGKFLLDSSAVVEALESANRLLEISQQQEQGGRYEISFAACTREAQVSCYAGIQMVCESSLYQIKDQIDTLYITGSTTELDDVTHKIMLDWLKANQKKIRRICATGGAVEILADTGLLLNSPCVTHWSMEQDFKNKFPTLETSSTQLFSRKANILTGAGMSAAIDIALSLIEEDHGRTIAMEVARHLVVYQRRPGTDLQMSNMLEQQLSGKKQIVALQAWIKANLKANLKVAVLADRVAMSPRNFARVFLEETGQPPGRFIENLRLESSKRYLQETDLSIEQIAYECGFSHPDTMRKLYVRTMLISPLNYRKMQAQDNQFSTAIQGKQSVAI